MAFAGHVLVPSFVQISNCELGMRSRPDSGWVIDAGYEVLDQRKIAAIKEPKGTTEGGIYFMGM